MTPDHPTAREPHHHNPLCPACREEAGYDDEVDPGEYLCVNPKCPNYGGVVTEESQP